MGNSYTAFAGVYDSFMNNIPYGQWAKQTVAYLKKSGFAPGTRVLELGCGTGSMTIRLARVGYRMTGTDVSKDMLEFAKKRTARAQVKIAYEQQDMRALTVDEPYPVIVSFCDTMNYLTEPEELKATFDNVYQALQPGGIFLFDLKTEAFYKGLGDQVFTDTNERGTYIWENEYDASTKNNYYDLTFFVAGRLGLYHKYTEEHTQHVFEPFVVEALAEKAGLTVEGCYGRHLAGAADWEDERVYYVLRRPGVSCCEDSAGVL